MLEDSIFYMFSRDGKTIQIGKFLAVSRRNIMFDARPFDVCVYLRVPCACYVDAEFCRREGYAIFCSPRTSSVSKNMPSRILKDGLT